MNFPFTVETQRGPYRVKFDDLGHTIGFHRQIPLRYPNPLPKSEYPQYSANDWYEAAELFNSFAKADLADKSKTSLPEVSMRSRTGPGCRGWEMADRPGYLLYHGRSVKLMNGLDDLRRLRAHIETYPTYTGAPETFESPNDTSWTYFRRCWMRGLRLMEEAESPHPSGRRLTKPHAIPRDPCRPCRKSATANRAAAPPTPGLELTDKTNLHERRRIR